MFMHCNESVRQSTGKKAQCTLKKLAVHFKIVIISQTAVKKPIISLIYCAIFKIKNHCHCHYQMGVKMNGHLFINFQSVTTYFGFGGKLQQK